MSGQHITQRQENIYMKHRQASCTQELSSAKAGISVRTGRRIEKGEQPGVVCSNRLQMIVDFLQYRTGLGLDVVTSIASGLARQIGNAIIRNDLTHSRSFVKVFDGHKLFPKIGFRKVCSSIARQ